MSSASTSLRYFFADLSSGISHAGGVPRIAFCFAGEGANQANLARVGTHHAERNHIAQVFIFPRTYHANLARSL
jgi:hypothetical protein